MSRFPRRLAIAIWCLSLAWVARNTLFVRPRSTSDFTAVDTSAGIQILIVLLTGLILLGSGKIERVLRGPPGSAIVLLTLYYFLCALSGAWSPLPEYTIYRAGEALIMAGGTIATISAAKNPESAERIWLWTAVIITFMSMGQNVAVRGLARMTSLGAWHTNTYSAIGAVMFVYVLGEYGKSVGERRKLLRRMGAFGLGAVLLGTSSASNVSALLGAISLAVLWRRLGLAAALAFAGAVLGVLLWLAEGALYDYFSWLFPNKSQAGVESLGGRTVLWDIFVPAIMREPFLGHGFAVLELESGSVIRLYSHNAYFAVILGTGIVGCIFAGMFLWRLGMQALGGVRAGTMGGVGGAAALFTGLVNSGAMPMIFDQWEESPVVFVGLISFLAHYVWVFRKRGTRRPTDLLNAPIREHR